MAGSSSGIVAGLTAAALATVGFLAFQASATAPAEPAGTRAPTSQAAADVPRAEPGSPTLPDRSGRGARVVYSLGGDRVWLVRADGTVGRTFAVSPSTVDPAPGTYRVTSRSKSVTGSDGVPVEHVVRFTSTKGVVIGFSAAVDGSMPERDPAVRTGGIRQTRADGAAMWRFATIDRRVVVVR
ncbi:hypothetical protein ACFYOV_12380 [Streptomyces sp. NPDC005931]|uniref:hypothetical protein n=1 Tax=Streptomyces sp. NPDC005931 TaxID=3364737 RepID=UPI00368FEF0F